MVFYIFRCLFTFFFTMSVDVSASYKTTPNIALVKYWGKRDAQLNLPVNSSLSLTLADVPPYFTCSLLEWSAYNYKGPNCRRFADGCAGVQWSVSFYILVLTDVVKSSCQKIRRSRSSYSVFARLRVKGGSFHMVVFTSIVYPIWRSEMPTRNSRIAASESKR